MSGMNGDESDNNADAAPPASGKSDETPSRTGYEPNEQRARVRERVRLFEKRVEELWRGDVPVPERSRHNSSLDNLMKHRSLNAFRFRWFANATAFPVVATIIAMTLLYAAGSPVFGLTLVDIAIVRENFQLWLWIVTVVLFLFGVTIYVLLHNRLEQEHNHYIAAIGRLAPQLEVMITNQLNQESSVVSENAAKIRAVVSRQEDMNQVSEGVKDTMRSWRRLERLPYYLRHAWDMYHVSVMDNRELPRLYRGRVLKFVLPLVLIIPVMLWSMVDVFAVLALPETQPTVSLYGLPVSQLALTLLLTVFYVSFFLYRRVTRGEVFLLKLVACAVMVGFLLIMGFELFLSPDHAGPRALLLMSHTALLIAGAIVMGLVFAYMADRGFKHTARIAPVHIVDALKTHKKEDVMSMFNFKRVEEYLRLLEGRRVVASDWGGWTPDYEPQRRQALREEGHEEYETEVRLAIDPTIYIGERGNRRIQVCQFDPTPAFLNAIPELRTAGG
ncbi:MAG: hypothetical protein RKE49_05070 [Oceanicaulis sp.]